MNVSSERTLTVNERLQIPLDEFDFRFSRAGGPGGQNVNRTASRVELLWDVAGTPSLSEEQRALLLRRLASYIDSRGVLHLVSQSERSQWRNREDVLDRLVAMLTQALRRPRRRIATAPTRTSIERRLEGKKKAGRTKQGRGRVSSDEW
jgi:ribosome-associated protein